MRAAVAYLAALLAVASCKKPEPPVLTTKDAKVTQLDPNGMNITVAVDAYNPNAMALSIQSATGHVLLDGKHDLGTVTVQKPVLLPPNAHTALDVPLRMQWPSVATLGLAAAGRPTLPYVVDGVVRIGGERFSVEVPYKATGNLTQAEILKAVGNSLPPGLPLLP